MSILFLRGFTVNSPPPKVCVYSFRPQKSSAKRHKTLLTSPKAGQAGAEGSKSLITQFLDHTQVRKRGRQGAEGPNL